MSGTVWMFSDQIDDEDIDFMQHDFVTYNMASIYYGLGMKPVNSDGQGFAAKTTKSNSDCHTWQWPIRYRINSYCSG